MITFNRRNPTNAAHFNPYRVLHEKGAFGSGEVHK